MKRDDRDGMSRREASQLYCERRCHELARKFNFRVFEDEETELIYAVIDGREFQLNTSPHRKWFWAVQKLDYILEGGE